MAHASLADRRASPLVAMGLARDVFVAGTPSDHRGRFNHGHYAVVRRAMGTARPTARLDGVHLRCDDGRAATMGLASRVPVAWPRRAATWPLNDEPIRGRETSSVKWWSMSAVPTPSSPAAAFRTTLELFET